MTHSNLMEIAREGANLGAPVLLFLGIIILGWVIVALDKRREKARTQERGEMREQFAEVIRHHDQSVAAFNLERVNIQREREKMQATLIELVRENSEATREHSATLAALKEFLEHGFHPSA